MKECESHGNQTHGREADRAIELTFYNDASSFAFNSPVGYLASSYVH